MNKFILGVIAALVISNSAYSQVIWQKAEKGMTVEQVKKRIPNTQTVSPTEGTTLGDGAKRLLELKNYEINGTSFDSYFYFKDGKLIQVTLEASGDEHPDVSYKKMVEAFRMKYGKETSTNRMSMGQEITWVTPEKTKITVSLMAGKMNVYYSGRMSNELDKI